MISERLRKLLKDDWLGVLLFVLGVLLFVLGLGVIAGCVWRVLAGDWWLAPFGLLAAIGWVAVARTLWDWA